MDMWTEWLRIMPSALLLLIVLGVPGGIVLTLLRVPLHFRWTVAPAATMGIVGCSAFIYDMWGITWSWASFAFACGVVIALAAIVAAAVSTSQLLRRETTRVPWVSVVFACVIAVGASVLPALLLADPTVPNPASDPLFHYNGVRAVQETGNASIFGAMDANYGARTLDIVYPATWHAILALVAGDGMIVAVSNAFAYVVIPVVYVAGIASLARAVLPDRALAPVLAPVVSIAFPVFPLLMTVWKAFWPHALGLAVLPAVLGFCVWVCRELSDAHERPVATAVPLLLSLVLSIAGVAFTHPAVFFTLLVVAGPYAIAMGFLLVQRHFAHHTRRRARVASLMYVLVISSCLVVVFGNDRVLAYMSRASEALSWDNAIARLASSVALWAVGPSLAASAAALVISGAALVLGTLVLARESTTRWILWAWLAQWMLILGSYFPLGPLSGLAGVWYSDSYRLFASQAPVTILVLTALGLEILDRLQVSTWVRDAKVSRSGVVVVSVTLVAVAGLGLSHILRSPAIDPALRGVRDSGTFVGSADELAMIVDFAQDVENAVVLGDAATGAGYIPAYGEAVSVFTQVNRRDLDVDGNYLAENFRELHHDPEVCRLVRHYGITHFYEDEPLDVGGVDRRDSEPGLYGVDTGTGFTLVAEAGSARLWQIDACGTYDSGAATWWNLDARHDTVRPDI